jgi:hypothetical protein
MWDLSTWACVRVIQQPAESGALSALALGPDATIYLAGQVLLLSARGKTVHARPDSYYWYKGPGV